MYFEEPIDMAVELQKLKRRKNNQKLSFSTE